MKVTKLQVTNFVLSASEIESLKACSALMTELDSKIPGIFAYLGACSSFSFSLEETIELISLILEYDGEDIEEEI